jgi:hypothetical protein
MDDIRYNSSTGEYIGSISTVVDEVTVLGEWTQVMLPYPLKITSAVINSGVSSNNDTNTNRSLIKEFVLAGSNDGYLYRRNVGSYQYLLCYKCVYKRKYKLLLLFEIVIKVQSQALLLLMLLLLMKYGIMAKRMRIIRLSTLRW